MRWTVKVVTPTSDPKQPTVEWFFMPEQALARGDAAARRLPTAPDGTRVHVHRCYNDETDVSRRPCVLTDAWEKQTGIWVRTV